MLRVPCAQATKTIDQMVRFIRQEAEEKANEIAVSAEEEVRAAWRPGHRTIGVGVIGEV